MPSKSVKGYQQVCAGLLQEYARLSADLEKLPPQREAKQAEQLLASEIAGLERDIQFKTAELQGRPLDESPLHGRCRAMRGSWHDGFEHIPRCSLRNTHLPGRM